LSLKRLEEAGLVEHPSKGVYAAVDQTPPPKISLGRALERQACRAPFG
jgi:hypothetical protein